jgi:hypothetical protein
MSHKDYLQINIPRDSKGYIAGTGEGAWVEINKQTKKAYNKSEDYRVTKCLYYGELRNDSINYPKLKIGTLVPIELRGGYRPVINFEWLKAYREV